MSFLLSWLVGSLWAPSTSDLPAEWITALSLSQPEEEGVTCPTRVLFKGRLADLDLAPLDVSIRGDILQQLVEDEWPAWDKCLQAIIKKRYLGVVITMNGNCTGSLRARLATLHPQLSAIYQRQQKDLKELREVDNSQIASLALLVSKDKLTTSSAVDIGVAIYRCLHAILCTILGSSLTKSEEGTLSLSLLPSLDLLVKLWSERSRLKPKVLRPSSVEVSSKPVAIGQIEILPTLDKDEMKRRAQKLEELLTK